MHVNNNADLKLFLFRWMTTSSAGATISRRMLACASLIDLFQIFCMSDHAMIDVLEHNAGKKWLLTKDVESFPTLLVIIHFVALLTLLIRSNSPGFRFQQRFSLTIAVLLLYRLYNTVLCTSSGGSRLRIAGLLGHLFIDTPPPFSSDARGSGVAFVRIVTCAMYAATGLNKILVEGSEWVTGTAIRRTLSCKSHVKYPWDQVGVLLPDFITVTLTRFVVVLEIGGAILLTMGVSDGWDHTQFLTILSFILFHVVLGVTMPVALFSLTCCANLLLFLPSESINKRKKAAIVKTRREYASIFSSISVFMLGAIVSLPSWTGMWHMYTHPPRYCGDFVLALTRSQEDVKMAADYSKVDILYDERNFGKGNGEVMNRLSRGSFRFGRVDQKRSTIPALHMLLDSFEFAVDSWITEWMTSSESQVYTIDFLLHKLAEHMCSVSSLRSSPTSASMIFWTGRMSVSHRKERPKKFPPILLHKHFCNAGSPDLESSATNAESTGDTKFFLFEYAPVLFRRMMLDSYTSVEAKKRVIECEDNQPLVLMDHDYITAIEFEEIRMCTSHHPFLDAKKPDGNESYANGFTMTFKDISIEEISKNEHNKCFESLIRKVKLPDVNVLVLNAVYCESLDYKPAQSNENLVVGMHLDNLRKTNPDRNEILGSMINDEDYIAYQVNVIYVNIPEYMVGGELQLWKYGDGELTLKEYEERPDFTIKPQENMMVRFRGDTFHQVQAYHVKDRSNSRRFALILEQYKLKKDVYDGLGSNVEVIKWSSPAAGENMM